MNKLLVPVDGSPASDHAVLKAIDMVKLGAEPTEVHVLHVQPPIERNMPAIAEPGLLERLQHDEAEKATSSAHRLLDHAPARHRFVLETGDPAETISTYAKVHACDAIVMGTRGLGALRNLALGSVAMKVVHLTDLPVMLVK